MAHEKCNRCNDIKLKILFSLIPNVCQQCLKPEEDFTPDHYNFYVCLRYMTGNRKFRLPKWVNMAELELFYKHCPKDHHVDHVIPLKGKDISGLHVPSNLQYLPKKENRKKSNKINLFKLNNIEEPFTMKRTWSFNKNRDK